MIHISQIRYSGCNNFCISWQKLMQFSHIRCSFSANCYEIVHTFDPNIHRFLCLTVYVNNRLYAQLHIILAFSNVAFEMTKEKNANVWQWKQKKTSFTSLAGKQWKVPNTSKETKTKKGISSIHVEHMCIYLCLQVFCSIFLRAHSFVEMSISENEDLFWITKALQRKCFQYVFAPLLF